MNTPNHHAPLTDRPLRVLFSFPHVFGSVGIGTTAWYQARGLLEHGVQLTLAAGRVVKPLPQPCRTLDTLRLGPIQSRHKMFGPRRAARLHDWRVASFLSRHHDEFDLVHCWPDGAWSTLKRAEVLGLPAVLERPNAHIDYAERVVNTEYERVGYQPPKGHSHAISPKRRRHEHREYDAAFALLCPSKFVEQTFQEAGFSNDRLLRHQYGYDPEGYSPGKDRLRDPDGLHVIFVGRGEPRKGVHFLLDAWLSSKACVSGRLTLCGEFLPGYRESLSERMSHPSIRQIGFTREIVKYMDEADALVLPSVEEGSALVTYEAKGCGLPVLVSDAAGAWCSNGVDGLIHPAGDVQTLRQHFDRLSAAPEFVESLRKRVVAERGQYTWSTAAKRLEDAYRLAIDRVASPNSAMTPTPELLASPVAGGITG